MFMHEPETVNRFIELRAQGWSYARLMSELNVTKPTLIAWSRKHQFQIQNLASIELEALRERWLASTAERVRKLGEQLHAIEAALAQRDPAQLTTPQLHSLARSLRRQIEQATGTVRFTSPVSEIPDDEFHEEVQDWKA
jgi:hypothetical protein